MLVDGDPDSLGQYKRGIAMDAVTKLSHFWKCGHATRDIPPLLNLLADAEMEIRELEADGRLNLRDYVDSEVVEEEIRVCFAECGSPTLMFHSIAS